MTIQPFAPKHQAKSPIEEAICEFEFSEVSAWDVNLPTRLYDEMRSVYRKRTIAGIRAARVRGERLGRPPALTPLQVREARVMLERGESPSHVARILRVGRSTLYRALLR